MRFTKKNLSIRDMPDCFEVELPLVRIAIIVKLRWVVFNVQINVVREHDTVQRKFVRSLVVFHLRLFSYAGNIDSNSLVAGGDIACSHAARADSK